MTRSNTGILLSVVTGLIVTGSVAMASPVAAPGSGTTLQPDGTVLHLHQRGNATAGWFETEDGYVVLRDAQGRWVYARSPAEKGGRGLAVSDGVVGRDDPRALGLNPHLAAHSSDQNLIHQLAKSVSGNNPIESVTGTIPLLVILGYYDDARLAPNCTNCATTPAATFQSTVFGATQSVSHYLNTVSGGNLTVTAAADTEGTINDGIVGWLRLGAATPQGTSSTTTSYKSNRIAADAINAAMSYVDFTAFDANRDGTVTSLELSIVVVMGGYEASYGRDARGGILTDDTTSPRLWGQSRSFVPAFSGVSIPIQTQNGRTVSINTAEGGLTYSIIGELHGNHGATMGIITHELGHSMLALPDLYDVTGSGYGIGVWSLMSYGSWGQALGDSYAGMTPVLLDAWSRVALGWVQPSIPASGGSVSLTAGVAGTVIKLPTRNTNEYFLLENRQNAGYDTGLTFLLFSTNFGGLAVWHIDDEVGSPGLNNDNTSPTHKRVDLIGAVGDSYMDDRINYGQYTNLFYAGNITQVSDSSDPNTSLYSGGISGVAVSAVSAAGTTMTATVSYTAAASVSITSNSTTGSQTASSSSSGGGGSVDWYLLMVAGAWIAVSRRGPRNVGWVDKPSTLP